MIDKILNRKVRKEWHEPYWKPGVNSVAPEEQAVLPH
jgi:hypothetical protein